MKKIKTPKSHLLLNSEEAMVGALNCYIELRLKVEKRTARHEQRVAVLNTEFDADTQEDRETLASLETSLQLFAENMRAALFATPKSREYANAVIGFRTSPPAVERRITGEKWETIAERVEQLFWGEPYVKRGKAALNKDAILRDREILTAEQLAVAGLTIEQAETFFIEPKSEVVDRVTKEVAA